MSSHVDAFVGLGWLWQVRGLEFSTLSPNLLASGADGGELCIWDLAKPSEPKFFPSLRVRMCQESLVYGWMIFAKHGSK